MSGRGNDQLTGPSSESELDELLSRPSDIVVHALGDVPGDVLVLGAGGKMGPSLARALRRALDAIGSSHRVIAVSRWSSQDAARALQAAGVETLTSDLADPNAVRALPDAPNVIFMAGQKFGTNDSPGATWTMNVVVPGMVARRYAHSVFVALSSGNVYAFSSPDGRAPAEDDAPAPVGEYAWSCLARERVLEHVSASEGTAVALVRLNYANALRYGVLTDIAIRVWNNEPVDVRMGYVNVIWQGDANARAIACLAHASAPPFVLNVAGPDRISVRELATRFGERFGRAPIFNGAESPNALLSDAARATRIFGPPAVSLDTLMDWTSDWVQHERPLLGKPTHFESRDGSF